MGVKELNICVDAKHLDCGRQNWLFGAGISINSNVPSIYLLTQRIRTVLMLDLSFDLIDVYDAVVQNLVSNSHIEHHLSHVGDLIAIAE